MKVVEAVGLRTFPRHQRQVSFACSPSPEEARSPPAAVRPAATSFRSALGAIGFSLPHLMAARAAGAVKPGHDDRSCIMIFNLGAPSNMDLWDMKPDAPAEIRGPFKPIQTAVPGFQFSEILPRHAAIADKISLVRSAHHGGAAVHDAGWQMMQTGRLFSGGVNTPHVGAVVSYLKGRRTDLPPFAVLPELMGRGGGNMPNGQAGGFLGKAYDPFELNADPSKPDFRVPDLLPPPEIGTVRLDRRRKIRDLVDDAVDLFESTEDAALLDDNFQSAFRLMTSPQARSAFDLTQEPQQVRDRYGMTRQTGSCRTDRERVVALASGRTPNGPGGWSSGGRPTGRCRRGAPRLRSTRTDRRRRRPGRVSCSGGARAERADLRGRQKVGDAERRGSRGRREARTGRRPCRGTRPPGRWACFRRPAHRLGQDGERRRSARRPCIYAATAPAWGVLTPPENWRPVCVICQPASWTAGPRW